MSEAGRLRIEFQLTPDDLREASWAHGKRTWIIIGGFIVLMVVLNGANLFHAASSDPAGQAHPVATGVATAIFMLPWVCIFLLVWMLVFRLLGGGVKKTWDSAPALGLPRAVEVDPNGIWLVDALVRSECRWGAFLKARETKNLFMLYLNNQVFHLIPKRAFPTAEALGWFRGVVQNCVRR